MYYNHQKGLNQPFTYILEETKMTHHESTPSADEKADFFTAKMEGGELVMEPFCKCGNLLDEKYFCEKCQRQCLCTDIICADETTFRFVQDNPPFKKFRFFLASQ